MPSPSHIDFHPDLESLSIRGWWTSNSFKTSGYDDLRDALRAVRDGFFLVRHHGKLAVVCDGSADFVNAAGSMAPNADASPIVGYIPPCQPEFLGDRGFSRDHGLKYPYLAGAMANGVGSTEIVEAMGREGMLGFFGAAGLPASRVEAAIRRIQSSLGTGEDHAPYGFNLIHSPSEPAMEAAIVDLYLKYGIRLVEASAYLDLTLPLIRYRLSGIRRGADGEVVAPNRVIAKVSRVEVARRFFSPPAEKFIRVLLQNGEITTEQAELSQRIPVAQDLTAEADSGGHTDNQPFVTLLPTMLALRDELQDKFQYRDRLRVGAAGGIGTPIAAAAAFSMGAAYILTGSINQACIEAGTSDRVREMLCQTRQADVAMAPAADMFEMGVKVQVLKRGTMFAMRAGKLYEIFRANASLEEIPAPQRATLEKDFFQLPLDEVWKQTCAFFAERDPSQIAKGERDPKHRMALVFRWYLGQSSGWAQAGDAARQVDYQIWCGPAMGAFNEWVKGTFLEQAGERRVSTLALNLIYGACVLGRISNLRSQGVPIPPEIQRVEPLQHEEVRLLLESRSEAVATHG